jgi:hypothetical protein
MNKFRKQILGNHLPCLKTYHKLRQSDFMIQVTKQVTN